VKDYIVAGGWTPYRQPERKKALDGLEDWLRERLRRHRGNADVLRQELVADLIRRVQAGQDTLLLIRPMVLLSLRVGTHIIESASTVIGSTTDLIL
jgi:hypothetical protein